MIISNKLYPGERSCGVSGPRWPCRCSLDGSVFPALAAAKVPVRLGYMYTPTGIVGAHEKSPRQGLWVPKTKGENFEFAPTMKVLEPYREHINVMSNMAQVNGRALGDGGGDHARATATFLTGVHPYKTGGADFHLGISADQIAAKELGKYTQLSSLEIGLEAQLLRQLRLRLHLCLYVHVLAWSHQPAAARINPGSSSSACSATETARTPPRAWRDSKPRRACWTT
jgi:hypothetical protein